jgi:fructan beta-fructosidase
MVVSLAKDKKVRFYGSEDLVHWRMLSEFGPAGALGSPNWECPNLFPLRVENQANQTRWVLKIDLGNGAYAGGSGAEYFVGEFDGEKFRSEQARELWVDYGKDFYAAQVWSDLPAWGRRTVWLGWMNNWSYAQDVPTSPWRGAMTVPRQLTLRSSPEGWRMIQAPVRESRILRGNHFQLRDQDLARANRALESESVRGEALEIQTAFEFRGAQPFGMKVRRGRSEETLVGYDPGRQEMFVDRTESGAVDFSKDFAGKQAGPLAVEGKSVKFHVLVDASSVEVFGNDGRIVLTELIFPDPKSRGLEFFAEHGKVRLAALDIWELRSIWS